MGEDRGSWSVCTHVRGSSAVDGLEVDFEGALPNATFGGDTNENADRTATISVPDPEATTGISALEVGITGATADAYEYTAPCAG